MTFNTDSCIVFALHFFPRSLPISQEQMRMPSSLFKLYSCLAALRDHKVSGTDRSLVFRDTPLEVCMETYN